MPHRCMLYAVFSHLKTKNMNRKEQLLRMAADAFADCRNPFDPDSLCEHKVTADECFDLSEAISVIIRGYLRARGNQASGCAVRSD